MNNTDPYTFQGSRYIHRLNTRCEHNKKLNVGVLSNQKYVYITTTTTGNTYIIDNNSTAVYWSGYVSPIENYILSNYRYLFRTSFSATFLLPNNNFQEESLIQKIFDDELDIKDDAIELAMSMLKY